MTGYHEDPMLWPTVGSAVFIGAIAAYLWRRRSDTRGARSLAVLAFLLVAWCLGGAAESAATEFATQRGWFTFRDALTLPAVVLAFWFALQYAGLERRLTRPVIALLISVVVVHVALEAVDGGRLLWARIAWDGEVQGDRTLLGLAFAGFAVAMFFAGTAVYVLLFVRSPAHRVPVALILVGQVAIRVLYPLVAFNVVYVPNIVSGVLGFDLVAAMYAVALFRFRMFDLVPVARETILQRMPDAMLVLDTRDQVADRNDAAVRLLGTARGGLETRPELVAAVAGGRDHPAEVVLESGQGLRTCQVTVTELADWQGAPIGRLVLLHDITELRAAEDRLLEQERALTAARERERLARDLHDSLGQVLGYLGLQAATIRRLATDGRLADVDERLGRVATIAGEAQADVRRTIAELARSPGPAADLLGSLRSRLAGAQRDHGIATPLVIGPSVADLAVPPEVATHLLRIVDESVSNAIRHGRAREARVSLEAVDGCLTLSIEDDGIGFEPEAVPSERGERYGLRFMRERALELGGALELVSAPGHGTRVAVRIPLDVNPGVAAR